MDKVQKNKTVSMNFSTAVFSLLSVDDYLVIQALVWLCMIWFNTSFTY